jgi:predicted Zn-dependent protease
MTLKHVLFAVFVVGGSAWIAQAQLPGGLGRIKDRAKPATDRAEKAKETFATWSPEEEQQIGEAAAAKMIAVFPLLDSDSVNNYVNLVGNTVAQFASRPIPYRFAVLDTDMVGAFGIPGGFIFVTKGALYGMKNESELAGALGHEIIHVSERHLESEIRGSKTSSWAVQEGKAVKTPSGLGADQLRQKTEALVKDLFDMKFSRDKEDGADQRGSMLAAQAGYAPGGLMHFLMTLKASSNSPKATKAFGQLLSTHPPLDDRIAKLRPWVDSNKKKGETLEKRFQQGIQ